MTHLSPTSDIFEGIADLGIVAIAEKCPQLTYLDLMCALPILQ